MATSEGVGLQVGSTALVLRIVLGPVKCVRYIRTYVAANLQRCIRPTVELVQ